MSPPENLPSAIRAPGEHEAGPGYVRFVSRARERIYQDPVAVVAARRVADVVPALQRIGRYVGEGFHAAGFIAYEAAPAFDSALAAHEPGGAPLLWFGVYADTVETSVRLDHPRGGYTLGAWHASLRADDYCAALGRIRDLIAAGDTYQTNFTFPLRAGFSGDPRHWFEDMAAAQQANYAAYIDTGESRVLSASPELFFRLSGRELVTKPMKGTAPRGLWFEDDVARSEALRNSAKERSENVMIVDLLRNDMGRVCEPGSVTVNSLFDVERFPTVWQMTSTIAGRCNADIPDVFAALFPSGSVTGAPKVRTSQIIRELEAEPRGVYCGAVGWWAPGREAEFSVAIRTAVIDVGTGIATYSVGSGVTWDSDAHREFEECRLKSAVLAAPGPPFELLETVRWDRGYFLLDRHLDRLCNSAAYFGFHADRGAIRRALGEFAARLRPGDVRKVRLVLSRDGSLRLEDSAVPPPREALVRLAPEPVDAASPFLYHKTTHRAVYDDLRSRCPNVDDVILWNGRGEITESTIANIVIELDGALVTPPVSSGLLPGVMRAHLLDAGEIQERIVMKEDLLRATSIRLINSVRKCVDVRLDSRAAPLDGPGFSAAANCVAPS